MQKIPNLYIADSDGRGRGVFAGQDIQKNDLIEIAPLLLIPEKDIKQIKDTVFYDYYFLWPGEEHHACIALGYGSLYNHSKDANAKVLFDVDSLNINIVCLREISIGDEIFIDYLADNKLNNSLWFDEIKD